MRDVVRDDAVEQGEATEADKNVIEALADPLRVPRFRFDRAWMAAQGARVADLRGAAYRETGRALTLPADHLMFLRVLTGWMNVLAQLDCTVAVRAIVPVTGMTATSMN